MISHALDSDDLELQDGLNFAPREIDNVPVGDIIGKYGRKALIQASTKLELIINSEFRFYPQNHSVARAAFGATPCIPYEYTGDGRVGFWSGFRPTQLITNNV
jgi:hypothetical protein